jgi:NAD(P)-dependent dehydrogenase (short-subunit alcohol dehydrogenase family)
VSRRVLVLGATSAIATEVCHILGRRGDRLHLVGRNAQKLDAVARSLGPAVAGSEAVDLTVCDARAVLDRALVALGGLDDVLVAHGELLDQLETERDPAALRRCMEVNLLSPLLLLLPIADHLEAQRAGRIAVITSVAGDRGRPRNFSYGAAKAGLTVWLEGLRSRLHPAGVTVHTLKPGPVITPMTVGHPRNALFATAPQAAARIVRAMDRGWAVTYVPGYWRPILWVVVRLPEWLFQRLRFLSAR